MKKRFLATVECHLQEFEWVILRLIGLIDHKCLAPVVVPVPCDLDDSDAEGDECGYVSTSPAYPASQTE